MLFFPALGDCWFDYRGCADQQSIHEDAWEWKCSGQEGTECWCPWEGSRYCHDPSVLGVTAVMDFHQSLSCYGPKTALYYFKSPDAANKQSFPEHHNPAVPPTQLMTRFYSTESILSITLCHPTWLHPVLQTPHPSPPEQGSPALPPGFLYLHLLYHILSVPNLRGADGWVIGIRLQAALVGWVSPVPSCLLPRNDADT